MWSWFSRLNRLPSKAAPRTVKPWFDELEARYCPSANYPYPLLSNNPPVIDSINVVNTHGHMVDITGEVGCANPGRAALTFSGVVNGYVIADSDGDFELETEATDVGTITVTATDLENHMTADPTSTEISTLLSPDPPEITNFTAQQGPGLVWTFSGTVTAVTPNLVTIQFGGLQTLQSATTSVDVYGNFSLTVTLQDAYADTGLAIAVAIDCWGQTSGQATYYVTAP